MHGKHAVVCNFGCQEEGGIGWKRTVAESGTGLSFGYKVAGFFSWPVVVLAMIAAGCTAPGTRSLLRTEEPGAHAIQDVRLRARMRELDALMYERMRTELELDRDRRRQAREIAAAAADLSRTVAAIVATAPGLPLTADEQVRFLALAEQLRNRADRLREQAEQGQIDAIPGTLAEITAVCGSCHRLFRKPLGSTPD
jgi:cytochrome c556